MKFLIVGGEQRSSAVWREEWQHYQKALALTVDWSSGKVERTLEYASSPEFLASDKANVLFKAGSLRGDMLYLCTQTEVLIYAYPSLERLQQISLPCFNDLHHVAMIGGRLAVVSTGLDMVVYLNANAQPVEYRNVLGKEPWNRFSQNVDYRKWETTKPHESHPNFIFEIDGEPWVSRFEQKDAVCLNDLSKRIDIGIERIHDGNVHGEYVYFTTVNGTVCVANTRTCKVEAVYDLNEAYKEPNPLGWCRGLHVEGGRLFVGFTAIRSTKLRENLAWIKTGFQKSIEEMRAMPSRVVEYDMNTRSIVKEVNVADAGMAAIFSVLKVAD